MPTYRPIGDPPIIPKSPPPMRSGEFLVIDNSNSFTKLALATRAELGEVRRLETQEVSAATLKETVRGWDFERVILSSVVPQKGAAIAKAFASKPVLEVNAKLQLGVGIDYPQPEKIGADRLANAAAAAVLYGAPTVVVDFGTAVTFDIVSKEGNYIGGVIAPGLEAMTDYLHQRTALLPKIDLMEPPSVIGKSTEHAMLAGAVYGYRGMVTGILIRIWRALGADREMEVVATGGYAELIAHGVREISTVHPNLTLEGLRMIAMLNQVGAK